MSADLTVTGRIQHPEDPTRTTVATLTVARGLVFTFTRLPYGWAGRKNVRPGDHLVVTKVHQDSYTWTAHNFRTGRDVIGMATASVFLDARAVGIMTDQRTEAGHDAGLCYEDYED